MLAGRAAVALRAVLCTVPVKGSMEVAEVVPEVTWGWSLWALACDIMSWVNQWMKEEQLQAKNGALA
jgi:hypothetical protein